MIEYEEALEYYQKSLEIQTRVSGQDHPDVADSFNNIGAVYAGKGDLENALLHMRKALEIQTRVFGSDHPDVAASFNNIGAVYEKKGDYENALVQHQKARRFRGRTKPFACGCGLAGKQQKGIPIPSGHRATAKGCWRQTLS